jgi:uncharacterized protein (DUF488 family)
MTERALLTVGHGTLNRDAFINLVKAAQIGLLVDVRSYPGSRRVPHMARTALEKWLPDAGVDYRWEPRLGGRRRTSPGSVNIALEHPSFRGYADYMTSPEFAEARAQLVIDARERRTVIMCAESVWWRCHRRLIADSVMLLDRLAVTHLFHDSRLVPHTPMPVARVDGRHLVYDLIADAPVLGHSV